MAINLHVIEDPGNFQSGLGTFCYQLWLWHTDSFCCSTEWKDSETESIKDIIADSITVEKMMQVLFTDGSVQKKVGSG